MTRRRTVRLLAVAVLVALGAAPGTRADIVSGALPSLDASPGFFDFDGAPAAKPTMVFTSVLNGMQTVPPSPSQATGTGYLAYYKKSRQVCYQITYTALEGNEVDAHLHAGAAGARRVPFLFNLPPFPSRLKQGCVDLSVVSKKTENTIVKLMKRGQTYINVHSDLIVDGIPIGETGEIRGQVIPIKGLK